MIESKYMRKTLDTDLPEAFEMVNVSVAFLHFTHYLQSSY